MPETSPSRWRNRARGDISVLSIWDFTHTRVKRLHFGDLVKINSFWRWSIISMTSVFCGGKCCSEVSSSCWLFTQWVKSCPICLALKMLLIFWSDGMFRKVVLQTANIFLYWVSEIYVCISPVIRGTCTCNMMMVMPWLCVNCNFIKLLL